MKFQFQTHVNRIFLLVLIILLEICLIIPGEVHADKYDKQIDSKKRETLRLEIKRKEHIRLIEKSKKNEGSVVGALNFLDNNIRIKQAKLDKILSKISTIENKIIENLEDLNSLDEEIEIDRQRVDKQIKGMFYLYKVRNLTLFPGYKNIKNHFRNQKILQKNTVVDLLTIKRLQENQFLKTKKIDELGKKSDELGILRIAEEEQRELLDFERDQQITYLRHLKNDQKLRYKYLHEIQLGLEELNDIIFSLKQEKKYSVRQKKLKGFRRKKSNLSSPAQGKLVHSFGKSKGSYLYRLYRRGVLVETPNDQEVVSILDGKVVFSAPFKGYQNLVIIDHGKSSFSIYGNLEAVYVQENDHINKGAPVGFVALNSLRKKHLFYFEIRYKKKAVNPIKWLKKPYWKKD